MGVSSEGRYRMGDLKLALNVGGTTRLAKWHPFPVNKWIDDRFLFLYTVVNGDLDLNGASIAANSLRPNQAGLLSQTTLKDGAGNDAVLTHGAVADSSGGKVDGVPPTISSISITSNPGSDDTYGVGDRIEVTVTFSETVAIPRWNCSVDGQPAICMPRIELNIGGVTKLARTPETSSITSSSVVFRYTVRAGDNDADGISIGANAITDYGSVTDNNGNDRGHGGNDADLTHAALGDDSGHKVVTSAPPSTDAKLSALTLSDVNFGTFASGTTSYTASVANSVTETTVSPTVNHSGASHVIKLGGVVDSDGVIPLSVGSNVITIEVTAENTTTKQTYTVTVTRAASTDATLSGLTLSDVNFGTFASGTTSYTADVASSVTETTVTPTVNHSGASYVIKLGGVTDADGVIPLAAGSNVITVEVTAEDDATTGTYTITVTRLVTLQQNSTDATLSALSLSGVNFGTFASATESYTASVANNVTETTVTPTVNDSDASYVIKLGGVTDADGTVSLAEGSNVITVEVTAENEQITKTYTVTVTRAAPSTDATLEWLALSGIDIGNGLGHREYPQTQTSFTASVYNSVSQTTVTAMPNHAAASYVVKLGGVTDADSVIALGVGSNVITVEVTAEDGQTTKSYTATVARAAASAPTTGELSTDDPRVNFHTISYTHSFVALTLSYPRNRGITGVVTQRYKHDGDSFVSAGADGRYENTFDDDLGGLNLSWTYTEPEPDTLYKWVAKMLNSQSATVIEASLEVRTPPDPDTTTLSSDATLSDLTLSNVDFEATDRTFVGPGFHSTVTSYVGTVANSVSQTTVTPTVNDDGASYVIKLGGVTDADGTISIAVGSNVITIEVTAEDGETTRTYTVTVTRAAPSTDATLSNLTLSDVNFGTFNSATTSYSAQVANSVPQTTVTPTVNDSGASYVIKLDGVADSDGVIPLSVGSNVITVEVKAEDTTTTTTYTVTVTRAAPSSSDATLKSLSLGDDISIGTFRTVTTSYSVQVANSVTETTVTPTLNHSGASYVIKLGGVTDSDGVIPLGVGKNVITVEVTAEDGNTTQTYTVTVTRAEPPSTDATLKGLVLSRVDFGTFSSATTSYTAQVVNSVSQTTVSPTLNDSGARYVIKLGSVTDADGVVSLAVGANVITVEVTAEDDSTTNTYTVTVTRAEPPSTDATLSALTLRDVDFGTFDSTTTSYSAQVANSVLQTKVTPTVNDSGARYVIKLGGVTDSDGTVPLAVDSNVITVEVTAEDDSTTQTYTVNVTRAEPPSTDATLSALTLSDVNFGTFLSATTLYAAQVANSVTETTVTPTVNDSGASFVIKLGGATDADGTVSLAVGSNVITIEVTAEDESTTRTYTVTVTRAEPVTPVQQSSDATLSALTLSDIVFGTFDSTTTSYTVSIPNSVTETTVTPTVNDSGASYVIKMNGVTDADGAVSLAVGSNVITVVVTAEDEEITRTYTVTVTRSAPPSTDATLSALALSRANIGTFSSGTTAYTAGVANSVSQTTVSPTVNHSGARYVIKLGGVTDADGTVPLSVGSNVITIVVTAQDGSTTRTYTVTVTRSAPLSTDATLSALTLSDVNFGTFDSSTTSYSATVANSISRTTVSPGVSNSGASYVVKLGGVTDTDRTVSLSVGSNVITIEVTAQDGSTTRTYTVTITRASENEQPPRSDTPVTGELPTDDPKVNFRVSGFAHDRVDIAWAVPQNRRITKYVVQRYEHDGSGFVSSGGGEGSRFEGTTSGGGLHSLRNTHVQPDTLYQYVLSLNNDSGTTIIESSTTVRTLSSDATLSALTLSDIDFGTFDSGTTSYSADVVNDVSQTTVTPSLNHTGASHVIKMGGAVDEDGDVTLEVGENVITVEVTAEDGETALTYTVTITREELSLLTGELASDDPPVNFRITSYDEGEVTLAWEIPNNRGITGYELERYDHDGTEFISSGWSVSGTVAGGDNVTESSNGLSADSRYKYDLALKSDTGTIIIAESLEVRTLATGATALSSDAALSALSLSSIELDPDFSSSTHRYTVSVASDVSQTTVTAMPSDTAASYVVKLGGAVAEDDVMDLTPGRNVITVHVTAEDGVTTRVYTVVVTRAKVAEALSTDTTLRSLSLSSIDFGTFVPDTTTYTAQVTNDVTQTTVTPVMIDVEAAHVIKLDGVEDTDGVIDLAVGANVITVEVTAEDRETTLTYTVTVTREEAPESAPEPGPEPVETCVQSVGTDGALEGSWVDTCLSEKDAPGGTGDRYARFYTFTLDEATDIVINLSSDEDTYLYLLDGHGKDGDTLHSNDDIAGGGVNLNSRLSVTLQPGSYTIEATTYSPETSGEFTLTIEGLGEAEETTPEPEPEPEAATCIEAINGDGVTEGSWDDSCLSDKAALSGTGSRYARFYTFTLDEATDIVINLSSDEDTYLYLLNGHGRSGTVLYEEDDIVYGVNTNSRLSENLPAGDYTIEATTYYAQISGDFTLKIEGLGGSP